ncbi:MAG: hypothetical protein AAF567_11370 [Actinomycetota bacterium]
MPEIENADTVIPLVVIGVCFLLMLITWLFTRTTSLRDDAATALAAQTPIVGQTRVTQAQLGAWHREHGDSVKNWIQNHESVLKRVSDGGLAIDLGGDLTAGHEALGPAIDRAIAKHPAPQMRAQLSALVLASRNTIESLKRSNWTTAESEHLAYLEYRDTWLDRLRQFTTAESQVEQLRTIGNAESELPSWLDREETPPG